MKKEHGFFNKKKEGQDMPKEENLVDQTAAEDALPDASDCETETPEAEQPTQEDVAALKEENQKLKDEFLRAVAESENIKKRCAAEIEKNNRYAVSSFAKDLLTVADNLQRAIISVGDKPAAECESVLKGVELTQNELNHVFAKFGIVPMQDVGKVFDPNYHRVVQEVEDKEKPSGTIVAELQTGYLINGRILREAMVVVTKGGK